MSFLSLSIRSRLYCGFGAIVFIALGLSLFSGWRLLTLQSDVGTMVHFSQASVRAHEVTENLQVMRRAVLRYMYDGDEASFKESTANEAKAIELLQAAIPAVLVEERRAIYQGLEKSVREFRAQREVLGGFITLKLADREALFSAGDELTSMTQKLVQTAHENGEPPMVQAAANVETALLLVRVANLRFMTSNDPKWITTFSTNANNTSQQLAAMRKAAPQELSAMAAAIEASFSKYAATFSKMSTNTVKAEDLYEKEMKPLIVASIAKIDELVAGQKRDLLRNQAQTEASIAITITIQAIAAALTALLGGLAAFFISRGISNPVKTMVSAMKALAGGNLKVEIPAQDKKDEIGEMAQAVLVFRDAAVENARLEEEAAGQRMGAEGERSRNEQAQREAIAQERAIVASSIGAALAKLAAKDLTYRMPADIPEAYRKLQTDFNEAIAQLEVAMQSVTGSTDAIQSGTQEISTASDDLSRRTEQQAASLEETAAALDEITATVKKSAEGATHARQVVAAADDDAKKSAVVVREAVAAMDAIAKSSQQVSQIIGVIDEIAFQTNLLALNAGVEAARAGDAGRGFAVVASEVRALAQRSAEAAKEIKGLISASSIQVTNGVKLVAETGKSLERIMVQVTEINEVVTGIAAGAKEQAMGLAEVNTAINQMDQVTQQNAAMVEQSTAASHSLSQETAQLAGLIGQFRVGGATGSDASMRQQLQKVAPHAFRQPVKAPGTKAEAKPVRTLKAKAANGPDANNWDEF